MIRALKQRIAARRLQKIVDANVKSPELSLEYKKRGDAARKGWAMRFQRRSAALRAEPVALSQAKPAAAIAERVA